MHVFLEAVEFRAAAHSSDEASGLGNHTPRRSMYPEPLFSLQVPRFLQNGRWASWLQVLSVLGLIAWNTHILVTAGVIRFRQPPQAGGRSASLVLIKLVRMTSRKD